MVSFLVGFDLDLAEKVCFSALLTPQERGMEYTPGVRVNTLSHYFKGFKKSFLLTPKLFGARLLLFYEDSYQNLGLYFKFCTFLNCSYH